MRPSYRERQDCWLKLHGGRWVQRRWGRVKYKVIGRVGHLPFLPSGGVVLERELTGARQYMGWGEAFTLVPVWRKRRRGGR